MSRSIPLTFLRGLHSTPPATSLGDVLAENVVSSGLSTLLDCLPSTSGPALYSPDLSRPSLPHDTVRSFVQHFALPHSSSRSPLGPNDRVMVVLPTGPENALALLALASYHTTAPVNASCTPAELLDDARRLNARAVVTTRDAEERLELRALADALGCDVVFIEPRASGPCGLFDMQTMGEEPMQVPFRPSKLHGLADQSLILHTSGTSGKKKVVPYSLLSLIVGTCAVVESWDLQESDVNLNMMPLFHVGGIVRNLLAPIFSGGSAIMCAGFDAMAFLDSRPRSAGQLVPIFHSFVSLIPDPQLHRYYAAPTIHHAILTSQPAGIVPQRDLRIRMIANAAGGLLPSLAVSLKSTFEAVILPSYGMTECMPIASPPITYQLERPGCSGIACGPHLSIRNPGNLEQASATGSTGAICVRGLPTFAGYEVSPDPRVPLDTSAFTSEGWFDSGDMGHMDEDGYLYITGRSKEIINKGGEVISPFEVEEAIVTAAKSFVKTALAFAIEHDVLQETIGIVVVPVPGRPRIGLAQLQDLLRDHLHPSKWPFAIVYMDDLPKNAAGKPLRIKLATRLNIGKLTDAVPAIQRHFEANAPSNQAALSEPIPCSRIHAALTEVYGVSEAALRVRTDGAPEAFVAAHELDTSDLAAALARTLPGYAVPAPLHVLQGRHNLLRTSTGEPDFGAMESEMSEQALLVRDIIGNLLLADSAMIKPDSDFFLLGGNSLLLGKLAYQIRRQTGVAIGVSSLFTNSTIKGIADIIEAEHRRSAADVKDTPNHSARQSEATLNMGYDYEEDLDASSEKSRGQVAPALDVRPGAAARVLLPAQDRSDLALDLSCAPSSSPASPPASSPPSRPSSSSGSSSASTSPAPTVCGPPYHLRWWIVNQSIRVAGRGIFSMHPSLEILYYRLLGARIGRNVRIEKGAKLGEYDLLTFRDGCRVDTALIRGFCVEREGFFRLDNVVIGEKAIVNTFTQIAPGAVIGDGTVYGPHASSHDTPSPRSYAAFNRTLLPEPSFWLKMFVAWPVMFVVYFVSYLPWFVMVWLMVHEVTIITTQLNALEAGGVLVLVARACAVPCPLACRARGHHARAAGHSSASWSSAYSGSTRSAPTADATQLSLLRRYINSNLLSKTALKSAFSILGTHYEIVSVVYRCMGAKIGKRVYWPGSGIYCLDPELLEIGNDVVFGSRSEVFTTDRIAMIADRVVLLPGCKVGRRTVMGSGAIGMRDTEYRDGSTWLGTECLDEGMSSKFDDPDTTTPFGRAFYKRQADYFVFPYIMILAVNIIVASLSAAYWSISAVAAAQLLRQLQLHMRYLHIFRRVWYRPGVIFGFIAMSFIIVLSIQAFIALCWVILTKWIVIGRRRDGRYAWDKSSYCQRWQLHLVLSRFIYKGYGNGGVLAPLTGTVYIVWYLRALGAKVGKNVAIYAGGKAGLMTEPDLVHLGDNVCLDDCSVVAHINSRGNFALNSLKIGAGCALRSGSRLLSGASMEDSSMLCEHTLLTSGDVADSGAVYSGWPAKAIDNNWEPKYNDEESTGFMCPMCRTFPKDMTSTSCGHIFCKSCITGSFSTSSKCPVCMERIQSRDLTRVYPSFAL
ncbi:acetyl-CoA synthetase-like protein [Mycena polygramma]|nr:acetyl-CoA synthetase-like protein [Mycena polygramma]